MGRRKQRKAIPIVFVITSIVVRTSGLASPTFHLYGQGIKGGGGNELEERERKERFTRWVIVLGVQVLSLCLCPFYRDIK